MEVQNLGEDELNSPSFANPRRKDRQKVIKELEEELASDSSLSAQENLLSSKLADSKKASSQNSISSPMRREATKGVMISINTLDKPW